MQNADVVQHPGLIEHHDTAVKVTQNTTNHFLSPTNSEYLLFKESYKQEDRDIWPTFQVCE